MQFVLRLYITNLQTEEAIKLFEVARGHSTKFGVEARTAQKMNPAVKAVPDIVIPRFQPIREREWAIAEDDDETLYGE